MTAPRCPSCGGATVWELLANGDRAAVCEAYGHRRIFDPQGVQRGAAPLETAIEDAILRYLNKLPGWKQIKPTGSPHLRGEPDRIGCLQGIFVALEVKRPILKSGLTPLQRVKLNGWAKAGAVTAVVRSVEDVRAALVEAGFDEQLGVWGGEAETKRIARIENSNQNLT